MNKTLAVARRELGALFNSPMAYIVVVTFLLVSGWMLFSTLFLSERAELRAFFSPSLFSPAFLLVLLAPAVSMRLLAEEHRSGTLELMASLPVRDVQVVLGKFLAAWGLMAVALLVSTLFALSVAWVGDLDWGPVVSGYLGMLLFVGAMLAIGLMCSAWTKNQIVAFIIALLIGASLYVLNWLSLFVPTAFAPFVESVSSSAHLSNMARGVIDSRDVLYFLSLMAAALLVAERSMARHHA